LRGVGLDIKFALEQLFHDDVAAEIDAYKQRSKASIRAFVTADSLVPVTDAAAAVATAGHGAREEAADDLDFGPSSTVSVYQLYDLLMEFGADMGLLISITLYAKIVQCLMSFFSAYASAALDTMLAGSLTIRQVRFERTIPELEEHQERLTKILEARHEQAFVDTMVAKIAGKIYSLQLSDYSSSAAILDEATPSDGIIGLLSELNGLLSEAADFPGARAHRMVSAIIFQTLTAMVDNS
ncbi:hypothetical protein HK405_014481, partial [Cladochytrium tenue]